MRNENFDGMNSSRNLVNTLFAAALRDGLSSTFGRIPSAAKFADAFNLRAHGTSTITRETARKWLRGDAIPEIGKMRVLIHWLNLDPKAFLQPLTSDRDHASAVNDELIQSDRASVRDKLITILQLLDENAMETLYLTAMAIQDLKKKRNKVEPATQRP